MKILDKVTILLFLNTLLFSACEMKQSGRASTKITIEKEQETSEDMDTCIFDLSTQTDDFLQEITAIETYVWDSINHIATTHINGEEVFIQRGGCDHFTVGIWKMMDKNADAENWMAQVLELAQVLEGELDLEHIQIALENHQYQFDEYENDEARLTFENDFLMLNGYMITKTLEKGRFKIGIFKHL